MGNLCNGTLFLCILLICHTKNSYSNVSCMDTERQALMGFKGSLVDTKNGLASWTGENCCSWYGITCNHRTGHVEKLDLSNPSQTCWNGDKDDYYSHYWCLRGEINSSILNLEHLNYLDLSDNLLTGVLSESLFVKLKSLKFLDLSGNYFLTLNVSSHWMPPFQLTGISLDSILKGPQFLTWLQTQRNLEIVELGNTSTSGYIPKFFCNLSSLLSLVLYNNQLSGNIPLCFGNLRQLELFDLSNNELSGHIPKSLCDLSSVSLLWLPNNRLSGNIPLCFGNLKQLRWLDLSNNSLSGHVPSTLGNLEGLQILNLKRNKFNGLLPSSLKNLKLLYELYLGENQLTGTIPEWIGKELKELVILNLESNNFYGNISVHLCKLSSLRDLRLGKNKLSGYIPNCFGN